MFGGIYNNKRVLITGNTGFKGSWLSYWLLRLGADVYGLAKDIPTSPAFFSEIELQLSVHWIRQDIRHEGRVREILNDIRPDFLFHLAAQAIVSIAYQNPVETIETNVMGTTAVLEALRNYPESCTAVIITSDKCYDNVEWVWGYRENDRLGGKDVYGGSKGAAELIFHAYYHSFFKERPKVRIASARAGNVIGGGDWAQDRIVPDCVKAWAQGRHVEIRHPNATRPWQHVLEPLSGYLALGASLALNNRLSGESYNFGPKAEQHRTVRQVIEDLARYWQFDSQQPAYRTISQPDLKEAGLLKLNCDKALLDLQWLPTLEYDDLIRYTGQWYQEFYRAKTDMRTFTDLQIQNYERMAQEKGIKWAQSQ